MFNSEQQPKPRACPPACLLIPEDGSCNCHSHSQADGACETVEVEGSAACTCHGYGPKLEGFIIPCLLMFLKSKSAHGYELMEDLNGLPFLRIIPDPGVIYRQLRRMKTEGLVNSRLEPGKSGPARTVYFLTEQGDEHLGACLLSLRGIKCVIDNFLAVAPDYFNSEKGPTGDLGGGSDAAKK